MAPLFLLDLHSAGILLDVLTSSANHNQFSRSELYNLPHSVSLCGLEHELNITHDVGEHELLLPQLHML